MSEEGREASYFEQQYDPRTTAPDADAVMEKWLELSEKARADFKFHLDIPYGPTEKERLDIVPSKGPSRAVLVFIHGGYWQRSDKSSVAFLARTFSESAVTLVLVNYNLTPAVTLDKIVSEVRAACGWVFRNIEAYGGDPNRIFVAGNSAGGHLTAMMAATDWPALDSALPRDLVKGGLPISGIFDLEPLLSTTINHAVKLDVDAAVRNSPIHYRPTLSGKLLIPVGGLESDEFHRQTRLLSEAWKEVPTRFISIEGCHHYSILLELANADSRLFGAALELME